LAIDAPRVKKPKLPKKRFLKKKGIGRSDSQLCSLKLVRKLVARRKVGFPLSSARDAVRWTFPGRKACLNCGRFGSAGTAVTAEP
jgi:hypothetical protein